MIKRTRGLFYTMLIAQLSFETVLLQTMIDIFLSNCFGMNFYMYTFLLTTYFYIF